MRDRRQATRFVLCDGPVAHIRVLQDVVIEHLTEHELTILARGASVEGEELSVHIRAQDGQEVTLTVATVASQPVIVDDRIRHRLHLRILASVQDELQPLRAEA